MEPTFEKIAVFQYSAEAMIVKGRLEADGIDVFLADNNTIDTDTLVSNAIGGVKLFVRTADATKAKEILAEISRYAVDNNGNNIICPVCNGTKVEVMSTVRDGKGLLGFFLGTLMLGTLPFLMKYKYHCNDCGNEFEMK
ncbi:DUF2007 domain-containing protein [Flavobacterium sp. RHBU_24]|uniref:DUF2007 domain-containing protein n=1 Tax=Flavobacterium sp. RHBU_24 TaxID=3391185 RepID=UPI003984B408